MDEKANKKETGEEVVDPARPLFGCELLVSGLYQRAAAERWGLTLEQFSFGLDRAICKRLQLSSLNAPQREEFLSTLHLEDLALACSCELGQVSAWEEFVLIYRPYLRTAAAAILRASSSSPEARELADSLLAELYGLSDGETGKRSLFRYFHGRSSLKTWLRAVLAQRHIDAIRAAKKFESLDAPDGDGKLREPAQSHAVPPEDPHRSRYVGSFQIALDAALKLLAARDMERLRLYYAEEKTLAEIGKKLGEHESSVSRNLDRVRRELRESVTEVLRKPPPSFSEEQIALCFEYAAEEAPIDLGKLLKPRSIGGVSRGKKEA